MKTWAVFVGVLLFVIGLFGCFYVFGVYSNLINGQFFAFLTSGERGVKYTVASDSIVQLTWFSIFCLFFGAIAGFFCGVGFGSSPYEHDENRELKGQYWECPKCHRKYKMGTKRCPRCDIYRKEEEQKT